MSESDPPRRRLIYGRRQGHRLRGRQAELMQTLLARLRVPVGEPGGLDPASLFAVAPTAIRLEIGFGGAEHLLARAAAEPGAGFLGAEPYLNGVAKLLAGIDGLGLTNIRVHDDDARDLLEALAAATVDTIWLLYPDPWPKTRHRKRRFIRSEIVAELARVLKPGGELVFASDIADYVAWTLEHLHRSAVFEWTAARADDWRSPPPGWPGTRYEDKALREGRAPAYLTFRRR